MHRNEDHTCPTEIVIDPADISYYQECSAKEYIAALHFYHMAQQMRQNCIGCKRERQQKMIENVHES